jgi:hypothetical protein
MERPVSGGQRGLKTKRPRLPRNLSIHTVGQSCTGDKMIAKSREMTGRSQTMLCWLGGGGVKTTEKKHICPVGGGGRSNEKRWAKNTITTELASVPERKNAYKEKHCPTTRTKKSCRGRAITFIFISYADIAEH